MGLRSDGEDGRSRRWQYTWEAQSHIPTLRLVLFSSNVIPSIQCYNLNVQLHSSQSMVLLLTWSEKDAAVSFRVPIPKVLVDVESPVTFRALQDHIEVKLLLLLPVDHPILSNFDSVLISSQDPQNLSPYVSKPLVMEYDVKTLSSGGEVHFYCRSCSFKLTRSPLRNFVEMPSVNWREVADNWFGACCCSFGGISEKLVARYVNSYTCVQGKCLLSPTSVTLSKDDLVEYHVPDGCGRQECISMAESPGDNGIRKVTKNYGLNKDRTSTCSDASEKIYALDESSRFENSENKSSYVNFRYEVTENKPVHGDISHSHPDSNFHEDLLKSPSCCVHMSSILGGEPAATMEILANQKTFLNGFLEDIFMARPSNLSEDIDWHEFTCPQCMSLLGAYPCCEGNTPVDGGVRLFKCYISTCLPVGGSGDMFSKYTMDKMFTNKLMECANDESSFRFVIRDLKTKYPALQVILINPDTWSISGNCSDTEDKDLIPKLQLRPIIKVLFSECNTSTESQLRVIEEWATKNSTENIFMLSRQMKELVGSLMSAKDLYPPSCASLQGLFLSSVQR